MSWNEELKMGDSLKWLIVRKVRCVYCSTVIEVPAELEGKANACTSCGARREQING